MQLTGNALHYDVIIVGAGPAGCACALALKDSGLKVAMLDKASFPRDKVCGDAIPGRAIKALKSIDPGHEAAFKEFPAKCTTKKTTLFYKGREVTFSWVREAFTCTRMEFDNFLFSLVKEKTTTELYTNIAPENVLQDTNGYSFSTKNDNTLFTCRLLIGADGAQSGLAKQLAGRTMNRAHYAGSVRAYYSNITGIESDTTEVYFNRRFLPSYLWVFPLPGNKANVGFGMLSDEIARRKINIKNAFYDFIERDPVLKNKFANAIQEGPLEGFGLPLGSDIGIISGNHFMLAGDAASLIDPISGDGIGNAMVSGALAARQAIKCFDQNNFTAVFMKEYDKTLKSAIGAELKMHYNTQRAMSRMPFLLDVVIFASRNKILKRFMQKFL